jgi:Flp pilus assembly protein TadD
MTTMTEILCPEALLTEVLALAGDDAPAALARIDTLLGDHPDDPLLHFLQGSLLAAQERYEDGRAAMRRAVELAPGYEIARFQLGLLELSSGEAEAADATLQPLADAPGEGALSLFALGLRYLARDNFDQAEALLRRGIEVNIEHPLVNRDMALLLAGIAEARAKTAEDAHRPAPDAGPDAGVSGAHLLLQRYSDKRTKH